MGGTIGLESELGRGSTFRIDLTLERQPAAEPTPPLQPDRLAGLRVLVADHRGTTRAVLRGQLESIGCRVTVASRGVQAIALLRSARRRGSVPGSAAGFDDAGDDAALTAQVIKSDPGLAQLPLVLLSLMGAREATVEDLPEAGFVAGLVKPVRQAQLRRALMHALEREPEWSPSVPRLREISEELGGASRGLRVLIVDDNTANQKVALWMLAKMGARADAVANGQEALAALAQIQYDVVLMDVQMPVMDGFEATAEIRRREKGGARRVP